MSTMKRLALGLTIALIMMTLVSHAEAQCKSVNGHITSEVVAVFSNGDPCPSPLDPPLCTEGRFIGGLKGNFTFVAQTLTPSAAPGVAFTTGDIAISSDQCDGALVLVDTSAFSVDPDGQFGGLGTVDGEASTGGCAGASGRIRTSGVFVGGCVDCNYRGDICISE